VAIGCLVAVISVVFAAIASATAPSNDNFANAQTVPQEGATVSGTNVDATAEPGEPSASPYGPNHTIWYRWTAPASGPVSISTCDSEFDTIVAAYTGSSLGSLTEVGHNDNSGAAGPCPNTKFSYLTFDATGGTTYSIVIDTVGDLNGDGSGPPRGAAKLVLDGPDVPAPPPSEPDDTTTTGTSVPVDQTTVRSVMDDLSPAKAGNGWRFKTIKNAEQMVVALELAHMNLSYREVPIALRKFPKSQEDDIRAHPGTGGQILKTKPKGGSELISTAAEQQAIRVYYWDPAHDKRYQADLRREAERRRQEEEAERNRCKLLSVDIQEVKRLILAKTFDEAKAALAPYKCKALIGKVDTNNRIYREYVTDAEFDKGDNGFRLTVIRPAVPDFTITWREDPNTMQDKDQLSLVAEPDGDWVLPRSSQSSSRMTIQVNERTTGRFVQGATLEVWDVGQAGTSRRLLSTTTNANGERTITFRLPKETTLLITATVKDGSNVMSAERDLRVREQGPSLTTTCGRTLRLQRVNGKVVYQGSQAELDRCRGLGVVPANLGDGRGTSTPRVPTIEQTPALTVAPGGGSLLAGTHNAISISGSNTIVGAAPGVIAAGGGNLIGQAGGTRPLVGRRFGFFGPIGDFLNNIATNIGRAFNQGVSNIKAMAGSSIQGIQQTANQLAQQGAAVPPPATLKPEGLGVIAAGGGNVIAAGGGNVIAAGGGNLISDKGSGLISDKGLGVIAAGGGNVIAAGGGNLMPVYGGRVIAPGGGN
jgi:hypothetical protein